MEQPHGPHEVQFDPRKVAVSLGPDGQLSYDPAAKRLDLRLQLRNKGFVTGRVLETPGNPFVKGRINVMPAVKLPTGAACAYPTVWNVPAEPPARGETRDMFKGMFWRCESDGSFRVEVPAGYPFKLAINVGDVSNPRIVNFPGMTAFGWQGDGLKFPPADALKPAEVRDIGDIVIGK